MTTTLTTPVGAVAGFVYVLFLPGYALVSALLPRSTVSTSEGDLADHASSHGRSDVTGLQRALLSIGMSLVLVPLLGVMVNYSLLDIRPRSMLAVIGAVSLILIVIAAFRRWKLPAEDRFIVRSHGRIKAVRSVLIKTDTVGDRVLSFALIVCVLVAAGSLGYVASAPESDESFTGFYILTENEAGVLTAHDYPTEFTSGSSEPLYIGVENHENRPVEYSVVVLTQQVAQGRSSAARILDQQRVGRYQVRVDSGQRWIAKYELRPQTVGQHQRLQLLLYKGPVPPTPKVKNAYREVHLWINVTKG